MAVIDKFIVNLPIQTQANEGITSNNDKTDYHDKENNISGRNGPNHPAFSGTEAHDPESMVRHTGPILRGINAYRQWKTRRIGLRRH